jgi:hypothetical protein
MRLGAPDHLERPGRRERRSKSMSKLTGHTYVITELLVGTVGGPMLHMDRTPGINFSVFPGQRRAPGRIRTCDTGFNSGGGHQGWACPTSARKLCPSRAT